MRPITQPEIDAELEILNPALKEILEIETTLEENEFEAYIHGNVRPRIVIEFNPRAQSQLKILRIAAEHDLNVVDVWQLEKDRPSNTVRMRFRP
jgi:hypothetical protein